MSQSTPMPFLPDLFVMPRGGSEGFRLLGMKCSACVRTFFPARAWCPMCFGDKVERVELSTKGKLYTYTICRMPLPHLPAPYAIGYVELPEGLRVFSLLDVDVGARHDSPLRIGMEMELTAGKLRTDTAGGELWCYKFRPKESGG